MKIYGYGEDALTLWALKYHLSDILQEFGDKCEPSDCVVFYRPSFGRRGGSKSPEFGEFDAIIASLASIYLVESKWDNLKATDGDRELIKKVQRLRHRVFSWYLTHWNSSYYGNWQRFIDEQGKDFERKFEDEKIIASKGLLVENLEYILKVVLDHSRDLSGETRIRNVLLFFSRNKSSDSKANYETFTLINLCYSKHASNNFVVLKQANQKDKAMNF